MSPASQTSPRATTRRRQQKGEPNANSPPRPTLPSDPTGPRAAPSTNARQALPKRAKPRQRAIAPLGKPDPPAILAVVDGPSPFFSAASSVPLRLGVRIPSPLPPAHFTKRTHLKLPTPSPTST